MNILLSEARAVLSEVMKMFIARFSNVSFYTVKEWITSCRQRFVTNDPKFYK